MNITPDTKIVCPDNGIYQILALHGWNYTVQLNKAGGISKIGCPNRFAPADPKFIGDDFIVAEVTRVVNEFIAFEKYDVLEVDYKDGKGWGQYFVIKEESESREAMRIVNGAICQSLPHWVERSAVKFRIVSDRNVVKVVENGRV